jgi:hypothetical protein
MLQPFNQALIIQSSTDLEAHECCGWRLHDARGTHECRRDAGRAVDDAAEYVIQKQPRLEQLHGACGIGAGGGVSVSKEV